mmetsp:Transcript_18514/g.16108  ORF Transcript_18514/g.16108 Transcript_18514/m.16108 type:complete len:117 (-) Transcript_18514:911-1261(-)
MIEEIEEKKLNAVIFNLFGLDPSVKEEDLKKFYDPIPIDRVFTTKYEGILDIKIGNKEDALKVIEKGTGYINGSRFKIRLSIKNDRPPPQPREPREDYRKKDNYRNHRNDENNKSG